MAVVRRLVERVKAILAGKEEDHPRCSLCRLDGCAGPRGCCPDERLVVAVIPFPNVYVHSGTCLKAYMRNPNILTHVRELN